MEYGEERGWWERIGDRIYEKEEWKKIPTERFRYYVSMAMNIVSPDMQPDQSEWFYAHVFNIPSYEVYNPFAMVLGYAVLDRETKKISEKLFKKIADKHARKFQITPADVLRYGRKWEKIRDQEK